MPIKFRCPHCEQFLGISRAKAGAITDCPTCGRTIRVPQLDGRVAPLPPPRLDLQDSRLRNALGALASLEAGNEPAAVGIAESEEKADDRRAPVPRAAPPRPPQTPIRELEPLPPTPVVLSEDPPPGGEIPFAIVEPEAAPLEQLAGLDRRRRSLPAPPSGPRFGPGLLLILMIACLFCGWLIGRGFRRAAAPTEGTTDAPPATAPSNDLGEGPGALAKQAVSGTVLFAEVTGKELPDRGARILALPLERTGTVKLSHLGFRAGSDPVDHKVFRSAVEALGGGVIEAGNDGTFVLPINRPGTYGLLIASRYQPRAGEPILSDKASRTLNAYFDRPESLLGTVRFEYREIEITADATVEMHIRFPVE